MTFHMQHPGSAANIAKTASSQLGSDAMRDKEVEMWGGEREEWKEGLRIAIRLVVISTRHRAAIWSGRLDMIIESASRETVAAKAISDCSEPFQGESTQWSSWLWRWMQSLFSYKEAKGRNTFKYTEHVWIIEGACREVFKVTGSLIFFSWRLKVCLGGIEKGVLPVRLEVFLLLVNYVWVPQQKTSQDNSRWLVWCQVLLTVNMRP